MNWRNALLSYEPIRTRLLSLDELDKGSQYEKEAINYFLEKALRKAVNLEYAEQPESLNILCKAEIQAAFSHASEQELSEMVKTRNLSIEQLTEQIASDSLTITKTLSDGLIQKGFDQFNKKLSELFCDKNMDELIDLKLSQLKPSLHKAIIENVHDQLKPFRGDIGGITENE